MKLNLIGPFVVNAPFGTEIAFAKGLRKIGHVVNEIDPNIDHELRGLHNTADATVVFKTCVGAERYLKSLTHPIVVYQPDDARFPHIRQMMLQMCEYADLFLSFDDYGAELARTSMRYRAAETLLLTADNELYCRADLPRDIDVSFIGSYADPVAHASRRKMILLVRDEAKRRGWNFHFEQTQDIPHVVDIYRRSKVVINHATDVGQPFGWGYGLQCRHFEVGMTATAILSNRVYGSPLPLDFAVYDSPETLISQIDSFVQSAPNNGPQMFGGELYQQIINAHMPEHRAAQLADFIQRNS